MAVLPDRPNLDQLRHQAKDLLKAGQAGDAAAAGRMTVVSGRLTLAAAQVAVARGYGFASWARLKGRGRGAHGSPRGEGGGLLRGQHP